MAVKPEIIKARLKVLYPKANLSTKRLDALAAKLAPMPADDADDAAVDVILNQANDFNSFEEIAREDDRIRTLEAKANTTAQTPAEIEAARIEAERVKALNNTAQDDAPAWAKALIEQNQKFANDLEAIKTGKITETKKQNAQNVFNASEVLKDLKPETKAAWLSRINIDSETPIEDQIKSLETEFSDLRQEFAHNSNYSGPAPFGTNPKGEPNAEEVKSIVDNLIP